MRNLRLKFVLITMSMLTTMVLVLLVISERYNKYWDEHDTYRIVKLVAANGYVKENTDEAIAFVIIDKNDKPDIQVNNTFLTNKEVKEVSKDLLNRGKKSWKWYDYIYSLKEKKDGTWQLVFIDFSSYSASYAQVFLVTVYVIFGLLLLTGVSIYLSRFIVQPAQAAIDREKQFVSDASHELKTPIASIRANAQVLQNQIAPNRYLNHILSETKRMEHLIQELLGLSKLDDKDGREHFEKVNLSSICQEMILSYESLAYEEGKLIEDQIAENIEILGQESQLKQLVTILLDNAIKHSLDNGKITVELLQEKKTALLRVSNPSLVYPDEVLKNLFERFYQAEDSRNSSSSFGLGLAIAKAIVEKHKGSITVSQSDDQLTFEVQLPLK